MNHLQVIYLLLSAGMLVSLSAVGICLKARGNDVRLMAPVRRSDRKSIGPAAGERENLPTPRRRGSGRAA